jgi:nicotinate-nucleotide pyrophosphorylase (carboxylating)
MNFLKNEFIAQLFDEDKVFDHLYVTRGTPHQMVDGVIKVKTDCLFCGGFLLKELVGFLGYQLPDQVSEELKKVEGKHLTRGVQIKLSLPFDIFISVERVFLNLLTRMSAIATETSHYAKKLQPLGIALLDTRKTTPGLRHLEKYATRVGGARGHRFDLNDVFMIKDNHKTFFGSLENTYRWAQKIAGFYTPIMAEIHSLKEFQEAIDLGIKFVMLDNFDPATLKQALAIKVPGQVIEVSGGIRLENIDQFTLPGVDGVSLGKITFWPSPVDLSLKILPVHEGKS